MPRIRTKSIMTLGNDVDVKEMCYKTVETFAGITGRKLVLMDAPDDCPRTDGYLIQVPLGDKLAYRYTEHELSHIVFRSDGLAKTRFVTEYAHKIVETTKKCGVEIHANKLRASLNLIVSILDDVRVTSLWNLVYSGSAAVIHQIRKDMSKPLLEQAHKDLSTLFMCVAGGHKIPSGHLTKFVPCMSLALKKVNLGTYYSCLVVTKWLVTQMVSEIIKEFSNTKDPKQARSEALGDLINRLYNECQWTDIRNELIEARFTDTRDVAETMNAVSSAIHTNVANGDNFGDALERDAAQMMSVVETIRNKLRCDPIANDRVRIGVRSKVVFEEVTSSEVNVPLNPVDARTVRQLRARFHRLLGKRVNSLEYHGIEVDVPAYIERYTTHATSPVFRSSRPGRGFSVLILIDRSQSMLGDRTQQAGRSCRILSKSLEFPFVTQTILGFQSRTDSVTNITKIRSREGDFALEQTGLGGLTPLPVAIQIATNELESGADKKHLFVISDGLPTFLENGVPVPTEVLLKQTRDCVFGARRRGIGVTGVVIGNPLSRDVLFEYMFGPQRYWKVLSDDNFGDDLIQLVAASFEAYLKL